MRLQREVLAESPWRYAGSDTQRPLKLRFGTASPSSGLHGGGFQSGGRTCGEPQRGSQEDGDATFIPWLVSDDPLQVHVGWHDALGDGPEHIVADTDPNDPNSAFQLLSLEHAPGQVTARFEPSSVLRLYTLQFAGDLRSGDWSDVPGAVKVVGEGVTGALDDDTTERPDKGYYRVLVEVP